MFRLRRGAPPLNMTGTFPDSLWLASLRPAAVRSKTGPRGTGYESESAFFAGQSNGLVRVDRPT